MARILLVDSYRANATLYAHSLTLRGHNVHTAYSPVEAFQFAELMRPELLIIDSTVDGYPPKPEFCGYCTGQKIMERHNCHGIMLSSIAEQKYADKAKRRGFARFIVKGADLELLDKEIRAVLREPHHT